MSDSSQELERRLRELIHPYVEAGLLGVVYAEALAQDAARIGAELEREACASMAHHYRLEYESGHWRAACKVIADAIRARGGAQ